MTLDQPTEFRTREEGKNYQPRPGSYAVVLGKDNTVAVVRTKDDLYGLPGGGAEPGESVEETLQREVMEECGCEVAIVRPIGYAVEYLHAAGEGYFAKQCSFFQARFGKMVSSESDHTLIWLPIAEAIEKLNHLSQCWALSQVE